MRRINHLTICMDNYDSRQEWEEAIHTAVMLFLNAGKIMTVRYDEPSLGIVVIEYSSADRRLGCEYPYWLTPIEEESVLYEDE